MLIADTTNNKIRLVSGRHDLDGGGHRHGGLDRRRRARRCCATINGPQDVSAVAGGGFLIADTAGNKIRKVDAGGDDHVRSPAPAPRARRPARCAVTTARRRSRTSTRPAAVVADATGTGFLIADTGANRVRRVSATGTITTDRRLRHRVRDRDALCGDAGPAALAALNAPRGVLDLPDGTLLVADTGTNRLRARIPGRPARRGRGADGTNGTAGAPASTASTG